MKNFYKYGLPTLWIVSFTLTSCNLPQPNATNTPAASPTPTTPSGLIAITATPPPGPTASSEPPGSLCDNDYFPSDDATTWTFAGNNSKKGQYTRVDTVSDSRDDGFTITTALSDVTYTQEFTCTEAGLINMNPAQGDLVAMFSGPSGTAIVTREHNSGITIPKEIVPAATWNQYLAWHVSSPKIENGGSFNYHYTAMGLEVVTVPYGSFDAMRIDVAIDVELGTFQKGYGTYTTSIWLVKDVGPVKMAGSMEMTGVNFSDSIELVSFDSP